MSIYAYHPLIRFKNDAILEPILSPFNILSHIEVTIIDDYMDIREELGKIGIKSPKFVIDSSSIWDVIRISGDRIMKRILSTSFKDNRFIYGKSITNVELPDYVSISVYSGGHYVGSLLNAMGLFNYGTIFVPDPFRKNLRTVRIPNCILYIDLIDTLNMLSTFDTQNVAMLISKYSGIDPVAEIALDEFYKAHHVPEKEFVSTCEHIAKEIHKQANESNKHVDEDNSQSKGVSIYRSKLTDAIDAHISGNNRVYLKFTNNLSHIPDQIPIYVSASGRITESDHVLASIVIDDHSSNVISDILVSASADALIVNICKNAIGSVLDLELICKYKVPAK